MDDAVRQFALNLGWTPVAALAALLAVLAFGWVREKRGKIQRRTLKRLYKLGEQLTAAHSLRESLQLLQTTLPELMNVTDVHVYVPGREPRTLQRLETDGGSRLNGPAVLVEERVEFLRQSAMLCYRNRSSIAVPDTRRSPLFDPSQPGDPPRSALFLPMFAQEDLLGVLAISDAKRLWHFSEEERALAQHLANQLAIGMKLLEQKSLHERALGGDKLSAIHRLIASSARELKQPLSHIAEMAGEAGSDFRQGRISTELAGQTRKATDLLDRILKLAGMDTDEESVIDIAATLRALLNERRQTWRNKGIEVQDVTGAEPHLVVSKGDVLPQVLAGLLRYVEERLERSASKTVKLRIFRLGASVHVEMTLPPESEMDESEVFEQAVSSDPGLPSLRDCRDLVRSHGGQLKFTAPSDGNVRLELEVPAKPLEMAAPVTHSDSEGARAGVPLTTIVLDPNPADQRALISALYDLGHRGVPSASAEEAVELARRLHFDVLFCAASLIGTPWPECYENARRHVRTFVLLTSGRDAALSAALEQGGPRTLAKPVRLDELSECLQDAGTPGTASRS